MPGGQRAVVALAAGLLVAIVVLEASPGRLIYIGVTGFRSNQIGRFQSEV